MSEHNWKRSLTLALGLVALTYFGTKAGDPVSPEGLGASPAGARQTTPYEILVTLEAPDLQRSFEHHVPLTRSEYNKVRFSPRRQKDKAIRAARERLARKKGYTGEAFGDDARKLSNAKVVDVVLVDQRANKRISLLTQRAI